MKKNILEYLEKSAQKYPDKTALNKIAARWPAKAVAQFSTPK